MASLSGGRFGRGVRSEHPCGWRGALDRGPFSFRRFGRGVRLEHPFRVLGIVALATGGVAAPRRGCAPPPAIDVQPFGLRERSQSLGLRKLEPLRAEEAVALY